MALELPSNAKLFTADAVSMYTNIQTAPALSAIGRYLRQNKNKFRDIPINTLMSGLNFVMNNNIFEFGDTFWHQKKGTAMGTPPAPPYATLFFAVHENSYIIDQFPNLLFYKRFIDDVVGIWIPSSCPVVDDCRWSTFQQRMNQDTGLTWEFSERSTSVAFMDLTISIQHGKIHTTLYEKALNLYLYIPPHSAHPPGMVKGVILGSLFRFYTLCSDPADAAALIKKLYSRLLVRGYTRETLLPLFEQGHQAALRRSSVTRVPGQPQTTDPTFAERVFFHLQYHPEDPKSFIIQKTWKEQILHPQWRQKLGILKNHENSRVKLNQLTVAYSRPPNLGNLLSYRRLSQRNGPRVSSFRITNP
jgi:hypothetical protein